MKLKIEKKACIRFVVSALIVIVSLYFIQRLLMPKYIDDVVEGAFVAEYYEQEKDHDVIFIGDCEVYTNFSPIVLWKAYGINSYIRGSAEQYIWQSYYLLEDTLRYEVPDVVIFNIQSLQFSESQNEAYNRMTLEGMEWSAPKVKSILASMKPEEEFVDYVFPILRYHTRWSELNKTDFQYMFDTKQVSHNGYYLRVDAKPAENIPEPRVLSDYSFGENAWKYLDMMVALCEENGIELILIKAPSLWPYWYDEWEVQVEEYAENHGLRYINFLEYIDDIGLNYNTDTYDAGLHLNISGAEKLSLYMGRILSEEIGLEDRRNDEHLSAIWDEKIAFYNADIQAQYELNNTED